MIVAGGRTFGSLALTAPAFGDLDPDQISSPSRDVLSNETDDLLARIKGLAQDQFNSDANVPGEWFTRWDSFVNGVHAWDSGPRWISHILGSTWRDELLAYERQFNGFRQELVGYGVATSTPAFTFAAAPPSMLEKLADKALDPAKQAASTLETIAIVAGVTIVGLIGYVVWESGRTVRASAPFLGRGVL